MMPSRPQAVHSESGLHTRFPRTSRWFGMLTPFWLFCIIFSPMLESEDKELVQFVSLAWLFVVGLFAGSFSFLPGPIYRERPVVGVWCALFISMMAASSLMSDEPVRSLAF